MLHLMISFYHRVVRETFIPLAIMVITPNLAILFPYVVLHQNASLTKTFVNDNKNVFQILQDAWNKVDWYVYCCICYISRYIYIYFQIN